MNNKNKSVLIVDASIVNANRTLNALSGVKNILKVEYAASGKDMHLHDISLANMLQQIKKEYPQMVVIVLTEFPTPYALNAFRKLGAAGYYDRVNEMDIAIEQVKKLSK